MALGIAIARCPDDLTRDPVSETPISVAIINTSPDIVRLLRTEIEALGFVVFVIHIEDIKTGDTELEPFLRQHDPRVIVYDLAPPYDVTWRFLDHLRRSRAFEGRELVLTSVNRSRAREVVGNIEVFEVVGHDEDLGAIARAVKAASRARRTR